MRRRGFTLIELLIVIGVLLVLMGMFFLGLNHVTATSKNADTKSALAAAKAMFSEYEQSTHLAKSFNFAATPPPYVWGIGPSYTSTTAALNFWTNPNVINVPLNLTAGAPDPNSATSNALANNILAMNAFLTMPNNMAMIQKLPVNKLKAVSATINGNLINTQFLLDSWGNPIIYVPSGGLVNVTFASQPGRFFTITSTGKQDTTSNAYVPTGSERPFFVSAGPDNDVSKGDDNVYSFDN